MIKSRTRALVAGRGVITRRLVVVISAVVFIEQMFYAVIAPLLPELSRQLALSKLSAGVLIASYAAGVLAGSLPGGLLSVRTGPRFTVCTGMVLLVVSTIAFGWLDSAWSLDLARFIEGVGGAFAWTGGLAWIVAATPVAGRGTAIGWALGVAVAGSLFGPAIGALATATGRAALFTILGLATVTLVAIVSTLPDESESSRQGIGTVMRVMVRRPMVGAMWLIALPAVVSGLLNVLGPLRLHALGAGAGVIGATFLFSSAVEVLLSPVVGRLSDRYGRILPLRAGLVGVAATLSCFMLPGVTLALGLWIVLIFAVLGLFWAPSMALLADVAERHGIDQAHAAALMNLTWAAGQIVGSACGGATAKSFGDLFPTLVTSGLCLLSFALLRLSSARGRGRLSVDAGG